MNPRGASPVLRDARFAAFFGGSVPSVGCRFDLAPPIGSPSRRREGDRPVVSLDGGSITVVPVRPSLGGTPQGGFTFCLRAAAANGAWNGELLREYGRDEHVGYSLGARDGRVELELFTDYRPDPLRLEALLDPTGPGAPRTITGRYRGHRLELLVDGVLEDEEWPVGSVVGEAAERFVVGGRDGAPGARAGFDGSVDYLAVWDRALSDAELEALREEIDPPGPRRRALRPPRRVQYGTAAGGGYVGDCFPSFHDGLFHFYHLYDRRNHGSKYGLGAHQWAHSSSRDLIEWNHHPIAVPITEQREGSICTGSVCVHEGVWYAFYATRMLDRSEHLSLATSTDGIHFEKTTPNPFASPLPPYRPGPFRDPAIFRDPESGLFHLLVTAELANPPIERRGGCLAHLVSRDLRSWEQLEPFLVTGYADQPECSELFEWRGWYYLVFSHFGSAHYRISRSWTGPWRKPLVDTLDGPQARVMKSAPFTNDRRIGAAFLAARGDSAGVFAGGYGGRAVFREYIQLPDGSLATRWPPEMTPETGSPVSLAPRALSVGAGPAADPGGRAPLTGQRHGGTLVEGLADERGCRLRAEGGFAAIALGAVPLDFTLRITMRPESGTETYGIAVRSGDAMAGALLLELDPLRRKAGWRRAEDPSWRENEAAALFDVEGLDRGVDLALVVLDEVFDLSLNNRRTLVCRHNARRGDRLFLYCANGAAWFSRLEIRSIAAPEATAGDR